MNFIGAASSHLSFCRRLVSAYNHSDNQTTRRLVSRHVPVWCNRWLRVAAGEQVSSLPTRFPGISLTHCFLLFRDGNRSISAWSYVTRFVLEIRYNIANLVRVSLISSFIFHEALLHDKDDEIIE